MSSARELTLTRVLAALGDERGGDAKAPPRDYSRAGGLARAARVTLFCERVGDYRATVARVTAAALADAIGQSFPAGGPVCIPPGLPVEWLPAGLDTLADASVTDLDRCEGVLTACTVAIAETGTIALSSGAGEGPRALTLVPDLHVCVVGEDQVVQTVPEAFDVLAPLVRSQRRPITFISGPSATSDIELTRIEGVHGPRRLVVLVVRGAAVSRALRRAGGD